MTTPEPARRCLLDTHALLWAASAPERLSPDARAAIEDPANELFLSIASLWEMAIKSSLGKLEIEMGLAAFVPAQLEALGVSLLEISAAQVLAVESLPFHHRDPFDRLLVVQARLEQMRLISRDEIFDEYGVPRVW